MRPKQSRKVRNFAVAGSVLVIAAAVAVGCGVTGGDPSRLGSSLTFDPLPSAPSGASATPGAGINPGAPPSGQTTAPPSPQPPATMTVVVPPPSAPAKPQPTVAGPTAAAVPPAPTAPAGGDAANRGEGAPSGEGGGTSAPAPAPQAAAKPVTKPVYLPDGSVDCARSKCIALTFSGGPGPVTRQFLQILDSHGAKGTFFVTGAQVNLNPDIMTAIAGTGNEVANGTWTQPDMTTLSDTDTTAQLQQTNDAIRASVGSAPTLFRPMGGHTSPAVVDAGKRLGLTQILWDLDSMDYNYQANPDGLTQVLLKAKPGQIVMLHDTFSASATAMDRMMTQLGDQGYAFVTVSQLLRSRAG
ncbi:polysaccharide deacetylase family protein [Tsukamurella paurometabola]|uniref:Bifunctional xylanase/deacetylase n=1 Tax=Tsukamurella paurometabola TaxID=2061 RepID=A0A3P8KZV9_TSUPA|nr:polysaccharide deacetylase family protein [Tsukamurella paurometabola]MBS4101762.1 polysaccharide deacetylase family protein [Tsukamurella paurometabola]UEA84782.1 polysaccharide deacetylase family protein [Tsukamurella paurometabola]VDR37365.1 Bifunctional xylanase/deacetylase precursor [Tsukamurella paurometabola]